MPRFFDRFLISIIVSIIFCRGSSKILAPKAVSIIINDAAIAAAANQIDVVQFCACEHASAGIMLLIICPNVLQNSDNPTIDHQVKKRPTAARGACRCYLI